MFKEQATTEIKLANMNEDSLTTYWKSGNERYGFKAGKVRDDSDDGECREYMFNMIVENSGELMKGGTFFWNYIYIKSFVMNPWKVIQDNNLKKKKQWVT